MFLQVKKIQKIFVCLLVFKCHIFLIQSQETRVVGNDTRIVKAGSTFTLNCHGIKSDPKMTISFEWQYPHKNEKFWTSFHNTYSLNWINVAGHSIGASSYKRKKMEITPVHNRSVVSQMQLKDGSFLSTLQITKPSYFDTGFYICIIRNGTKGNIIQTSEQHIFVQDPDALFVPPTSSDEVLPEVIGIVSQPNLILGCRPTHPFVRVKLFYISDPKSMNRKLMIASSNNKLGNDSWSFNPLKGFIFNKTVTHNITGFYECSVDESSEDRPRPNVFRVAVFQVEISGVEIILSTNSEQVPAETSFEITCLGRNRLRQTTLEMRLSWLWIPDEPFNDQKEVLLNETRLPPGFLKINNSRSKELLPIRKISMKWQSIPVEASGIYQCTDLDNNDIYPSASTRLNVSFHLPQRFEIRQIFTEVYSSTRKELERRFHLEEKIYKAGDRFQMECKSNSALGLQWMKMTRRGLKLDKEFLVDVKGKYLDRRLSNSFSSSSVTITVVNASFLDTGYYFCLDPRISADGSYNLFGSKFIFIRDSQHLVLPPRIFDSSDRYFPGISEIRRETVVLVNYGGKNVPIGCGPTHPNVQVFLNHRNKNEKFKVVFPRFIAVFDFNFLMGNFIYLKTDFKTDISQVVASSSTPNDEKSVWTFSTHEGFLLKTVDSWEMLEGEFYCAATWPNETTTTSDTQIFKILVQGVEITSLNSTTVFEGDELTLTCKSKYQSGKLSWTWQSHLKTDQQLEPDEHDYHPKIMGEENQTLEGNFTILRLRFKEIQVEAAGIYQCHLIGSGLSRNISVNVSRLEIPIIYTPKQEINASHGEQVILTCPLGNSVIPKVKVEWFVVKSDGNPYLIEPSSSDYTINPIKDERTSELIVHQAVSDAKFICVFRNWKGNARKEFIFNVQPKVFTGGIIAAIVITIIVILMIVILAVRWRVVKSIRIQKRMYQELVNTRLKLLEGNLERIDPDKPIEDQIELLPYDSKYEFPIDRLVLGKQLGVGQFGRVVKAEAIGLKSSGNKTVAVKMVKNETDHTALSSLASEMKILIHLRSHLNVVSLLGACTKKLNRGELLVIVEFCRYGNLKDFLVKSRNNFINEYDLITDCQIKGNDEAQPSTEASENISSTQVDEGYLIPYCNKNDKNIRKPSICMHDLMNWSFQVARGMNYLTKRKVLHGDLAARNVLLADDDIVKIADFGLSRKLYRNYDYEKQGEEALPVKWMAIESLIDRVFSSKSDVWAFGVTMWEIFTLGQQPYPKLFGFARLIEFLQNGHRMEKPEYAPQVIGQIMSDCWKQNPDERITFAQLETILGQLLDEKTLPCKIPSDEHKNLDVKFEFKSTSASHDYSNNSSQATGEHEPSMHEGCYENLIIQGSNDPSKEVSYRSRTELI